MIFRCMDAAMRREAVATLGCQGRAKGNWLPRRTLPTTPAKAALARQW